MNREEARLELDATTLRPQDASPEARALLEDDPELRQWHAQRTLFDEQVAESLAIPPPANLRNNILQCAKQRKRFGKARWISATLATAAAASLAAAWLFFWPVHDAMPAWQADAMREVTKLEYGMSRLEDHSATLDQVKAVLAAAGSPLPDELPHALASTRTFGCKRISVSGRTATIICFRLGEGRREAHLVVVDMAGDPLPGPRIERNKNWTVASWSTGPKTYLLATTQGEEELRRLLEMT